MEICSFVCEVNSLRQASCVFLLQQRRGTRIIDVSAEAKYSGAALFCKRVWSNILTHGPSREGISGAVSFPISASHLRKAKESWHRKEGKHFFLFCIP